MLPPRTVVRTGVCQSCLTQLTHVLVIQPLDQRRAHGDTVEWRCPTCGEPGTIEGKAREQIVERFTGPDYGWMWPFRSMVEGWYDRVVNELQAEPRALEKA